MSLSSGDLGNTNKASMQVIPTFLIPCISPIRLQAQPKHLLEWVEWEERESLERKNRNQSIHISK
jgi:hypothetical protein